MENFGLSQNNLAWCYYKGEGLEKDDVKAYVWYSLAEENGNEFTEEDKGAYDGLKESLEEHQKKKALKLTVSLKKKMKGISDAKDAE